MMRVGWLWTDGNGPSVRGGMDTNTQVYVYLDGTVYAASPSGDLTTLLTRRINALTGEATARFKSIIASAGASN